MKPVRYLHRRPPRFDASPHGTPKASPPPSQPASDVTPPAEGGAPLFESVEPIAVARPDAAGGTT